MNSIPGADGSADVDNPKEGIGETDEEILQECRDRYQQCITNDAENRNMALDDLRFLAGEQWPIQAKQLRTLEGRPCLTINKLPTFLHQITNEQRMNKLGGKIHPVDENADEETAEVVQGMVRHIEYDSNATVATVTAVNSAAAVGFGFFRLATDFESPKSFDQKIMFKRIRNALSVHIDPLSQEPDGSDMQFCFIDSLEPRAEFKRQYPDANANNTNLIGQQMYQGWFTENTVLVCEYYRVKKTEAELCRMVDGTVAWADEIPPAMKKLVKDRRKSYKCEVEWFKVTGSDVLERTVIKCKWIPVFPVYGDEIDIEGKVIRSGMVRPAKDPAQMYNYWMTSATEEVSLRPKTPFIMAEGQDEGYENMWATANTRSYSSLIYKPTTVDGLLVPPPQRQQMADVPTGVLAMAMHASDNIKATTGLFDSSLGARGNATSGVQEREQNLQGDMANYHYADNLKITYRHALRCIVDMIPHYYDAARTVRILGEDETSEVVKINQPIEHPNKETGAIETVMHNLTIGEYDVTVSSGPAYTTQRQEAAEFMTDAMQAAKDPAAASVLTYLAIKNRDLAGAEEATKMLKKLLPPGVAEPEDGEQQEPVINTPKGPMPASQVGQLIEEMGLALQNADQAIEKAGMEKIAAQREAEANRARELAIKAEEARIKAFEAETARVAAEAKAQAEVEQAQANIIKAEADRMQAETDRVQAEADALRAHAEAVTAEKTPAPNAPPGLEEIATLLQANRAMVPKGMVVKAPSGQTYQVEIG